jgi:membrane protease YdiL (CAAX protease family)
MKRLAQFFRSIIPADPWQLVFLAGVIFLFICPRLPWRPSAEILVSKAGPVGSTSESVAKSFGLVIVLLYPAIFAGLMGYATCFYPGRRPVRRILWFVFLPALLSLVFIFPILYRVSQPATSVLERATPFFLTLQWFRSNIRNFPVGLCFCVFSLLLILVFAVRLQPGKSSLPLALPVSSISRDETADSWKRTLLLVFVLLCPLFLINGLVGFPLIFAYFLSKQPLSSLYLGISRIIAALIDAGVPIVLALCILGESGRKMVRTSFRLPELHDAFFAFLLPVGFAGLLSAPGYLIARTNWAIYAVHQASAPQFTSYFDLARAKDPWFLLMAVGAFAEEFVFRGLLLSRLSSRYGFHRGIFLTGIIWAAYHFRGDSYSGLSVGGVLFHLVNRILICLAMNYVLAWMTLRWKSIIPAGIAHTVSNILVVAGVNDLIPWSGEIWILEWALIAFLLFRYWPFAPNESSEASFPSPDLESAI